MKTIKVDEQGYVILLKALNVYAAKLHNDHALAISIGIEEDPDDPDSEANQISIVEFLLERIKE